LSIAKAIADWGASPDRLYELWLAVFALALTLASFGAWYLACRPGRGGGALVAAWTLLAPGPIAFCVCDACRRLDAALTEPAALVSKAVLIAVATSAAYWLPRRHAGPSGLAPARLSLLLVAGVAAAAAWAAHCFYQAVEPTPATLPPMPAAMAWLTVDSHQGKTDRGNTIPLLAPDTAQHYGDVPISVQFSGRFNERLIELAPPDDQANCHGWVFTGGSFGVRGKDVDSILSDNSYQQVQQPRAGDLIVYRESGGRVVHSGIVRLAEPDLVLVESKWGGNARYLHRLFDQAYGDRCEFYRSARHGHLLGVLPVTRPSARPTVP
jgi:hypothetical protein